MYGRTIFAVLLFGVLRARALPQADDATETAASSFLLTPIESVSSLQSTTTSSPISVTQSLAVLTTQTTAAPSSLISAAAALPTTGTSARLIGWSSGSARYNTTRYLSATCSRSSIYVTSTSNGTTYAGCCDTRRAGGIPACMTRELAYSCANGNQMKGTRTISDCGTSSTCAYAYVFEDVGDEERDGVEPISFVMCKYYGSRFGTLFRNLPATYAVTRDFRATSTRSSFLDDDDDDEDPIRGFRQTAVAAVGGVIAFIALCVVLPCCLLRAKKRQNAEGGRSAARPSTFRRNPPEVTGAPAPPYSPPGGGGGESGYRSVLDPGSGGGQPKPEDVPPPPRYEDVGRDRIVR